MIENTRRINGLNVTLVFAPEPDTDVSEQAFEILTEVLTKSYRVEKCL